MRDSLRTMQMFNRLETEIFKWVQSKFPGSAISQQLDTAKLTHREWTKVGFYVEFQVDRSLEKYDRTFPIDGPEIRSNDVEHGGGSLLWGKDGYLDCLEMYAYGDFFREEVEEFELLGFEQRN